jgi:hypothetical protein
VNGDPVAHGVVVSAAVTNVTVEVDNSTEFLSGAALAAWLANASWTVHLPNGTSYTTTGGSVSLPSDQYVTLNATAGDNSVPIVVDLANTNSALAAVVDLSVSEFCEPSGTGSVSTTYSPSWQP